MGEEKISHAGWRDKDTGRLPGAAHSDDENFKMCTHADFKFQHIFVSTVHLNVLDFTEKLGLELTSPTRELQNKKKERKKEENKVHLCTSRQEV